MRNRPARPFNRTTDDFCRAPRVDCFVYDRRHERGGSFAKRAASCSRATAAARDRRRPTPPRAGLARESPSCGKTRRDFSSPFFSVEIFTSMHADRRLPLLLLALSLPVTTSYGRVYSLSPHLGDVGGGMRVNLTGRDFVDYGDVRSPVRHQRVDARDGGHGDEHALPHAGEFQRPAPLPARVAERARRRARRGDVQRRHLELVGHVVRLLRPRLHADQPDRARRRPTSGDTAVAVHGRHLRGPGCVAPRRDAQRQRLHHQRRAAVRVLAEHDVDAQPKPPPTASLRHDAPSSDTTWRAAPSPRRAPTQRQALVLYDRPRNAMGRL